MRIKKGFVSLAVFFVILSSMIFVSAEKDKNSYSTEYHETPINEIYIDSTGDGTSVSEAYSFYGGTIGSTNTLSIESAYEMYAIDITSSEVSAAAISIPTNTMDLSIPSYNSLSFSSSSESKFYKIVPSATGRYCFKAVSESLDTAAWLYDASGNQLAQCDIGYVLPNIDDFHINEILNAGTTYYLKVTCKSGAGTFEMYAYSDDYLDGSWGATTLSFGTNIDGTVNYAYDHDLFKFTPSVTGTYTFFTVGDSDTFGYLCDSSLNILSENDDTDESSNFKITYALTAGTDYYISVQGYNNDATGEYKMCVGIGDSFIGEISEDESITVNLTEDSNAKWYKFIPLYSGRYCIKARSGNRDTMGLLYNENFEQISYCDTGYVQPNFDDFHLNEILTGGEIYYVRAEFVNDKSEGSFVLDCFYDDYLDGTYSSAVFELGDQKTGVINYVSDRDMFKFVPTSTSNYAIATTGVANVKVNVYDSSLALLTSAEGERTSFLYSMTSGKTYYVEVSASEPLKLGSFILDIKIPEINFNRANAVSDPGMVTMSYTAGGSNLFRFVPQTTGFYSIKAESTYDNQTNLYLYDKCGQYIMSCWYGRAGDNIYDCHMGEVLTANEIYYVKIVSSDAQTFPVYFYADDFTDGTNVSNPIDASVDYDATINYASDRDVFYFTPIISGKYKVTISGSNTADVKIYETMDHEECDLLRWEREEDVYEIYAYMMEGICYYIDVYNKYETVEYTLAVTMEEPLNQSDIILPGDALDVFVPAQNSNVYSLFVGSNLNYTLNLSSENDINPTITDSTGGVIATLSRYEFTDKYSYTFQDLPGDIYYLNLNNNSSSGSEVDISLYKDDFGNILSGAEYQIPGIVKGSIEMGGDADAYEIYAPETGMYRIKYEGNHEMKFTMSPSAPSSIKTVITGKTINEDILLSEHSCYYILVEHASPYGKCDYEFLVNIPELDFQDVSDIGVGETTYTQDTIYSFVAPETGTYLIEVPVESSITLYDGYERLLDYSNYITPGNIVFSAQKGMTYYIDAGASDTYETGGYTFKLSPDEAGDTLCRNSPSIEHDGIVTMVMNSSSDKDSMYLYPSIESSYTIAISAETEVVVGIFDGDGTLVSSGNGCEFTLSADLSDSWYELVVSGTANTVSGKKYTVGMYVGNTNKIYTYAADGEIVNVEFYAAKNAKTYTLSYSSEEFEIYDLCGLTYELETAACETAGINIISVTDGNIVFEVKSENDDTDTDEFVNKAINIVRLKAKKAGILAVECSNN